MATFGRLWIKSTLCMAPIGMAFVGGVVWEQNPLAGILLFATALAIETVAVILRFRS